VVSGRSSTCAHSALPSAVSNPRVLLRARPQEDSARSVPTSESWEECLKIPMLCGVCCASRIAPQTCLNFHCKCHWYATTVYVEPELLRRALHFIYGLYDPAEPMHIRYIGQTSKGEDRPLKHIYRPPVVCTTHKEKWLNVVFSEGRQPDWVYIDFAEDKTELDIKECRFIKKFKEAGHHLTNGTEGGDGWKGARHSVETKAKWSYMRKGIIPSNLEELHNLPQTKAAQLRNLQRAEASPKSILARRENIKIANAARLAKLVAKKNGKV